ncbi:MAG: L,D-transpeptidase [Sulfurovum sp.]|nr:MAG: L,D-transpeptidase [Sulfurovum sp.]
MTVLFAIVLSGCVGTPDAEGWRYGQRSDFLDILKTDKYASICNQKALYAQVKSTKNSKLMSKLLVAYAQNLSNGCIDKRTLGEYGIYKQKVSETDIKMKLKAGETIEQILKPYIPDFRQFDMLIAQYHLLKKNEDASAELLHKLRLNIERVKVMKPGLGNTYALVNIPEYVIRVIENGKMALTMKVIVGTRKNQTPIFSENLQYIVLNPTWNVPDSIARNEIIPKTLKNPGYLKSHRLVMRRDYDLTSPALSFNSVNPRAYVGGEGPVPFKFIEVPSNRNALGRVKFIFPNRHSVYMHDTPSKHLFKRKVRSYSHGCVRLENPKHMLKHISTNYTAHEYKAVKVKYDSKKTHYLQINKLLPVHTAYLTAYVDEKGKLALFDDIYSLDKSQRLNF